jgi:hypothetical protein
MDQVIDNKELKHAEYSQEHNAKRSYLEEVSLLKSKIQKLKKKIIKLKEKLKAYKE